MYGTERSIATLGDPSTGTHPDPIQSISTPPPHHRATPIKSILILTSQLLLALPI
jgi:hypothetical protein